MQDMVIISQKLRELRIIRPRSGSLKALSSSKFPKLEGLKLEYCLLNSEDIQSLAQAYVEEKLPLIRHLDILDFNGIEISDLFAHSANGIS